MYVIGTFGRRVPQKNRRKQKDGRRNNCEKKSKEIEEETQIETEEENEDYG